MSRLSAAVVALFALTAPALAGGIVVPAEDRYRPFAAELPACDDTIVLWRVTSDFAYKESRYWNSEMRIDAVEKIQEIGYRSNGLGYIPRRYCVGAAKMSDNKVHKVVYSIVQSGGFVGLTFGVESCVVGFDRNLAFAPACGVLRPILDRQSGEKVKLQYP